MVEGGMIANEQEAREQFFPDDDIIEVFGPFDAELLAQSDTEYEC